MRSAVLAVALVAGVALVSSCDATGPKSGPPASIQKKALPGSAVVGATLDSVGVTVFDGDGKPVEGAQVTWTAAAGSAAPASSRTNSDGTAFTSWTLGTVAGEQQLTAGVGSLAATFRPNVLPGPLAAVFLDKHDIAFASLGDTVRLHAEGRDAYDNARTIPELIWSITDPDVVSVTGGVIVALSEGSGRIMATSGSLGDTADVVVDQVVVGLRIDPAEPVLVPGETASLTARAADARGNPADTTVVVSWSSSDDAVAPIDADGTLHALAVGEATIAASAGPLSGETITQVKTGPRPTITAITPALLGAGDTATITGTDFSADTALDRVTVGGMDAAVLSATPTAITAVLPGPGVFPCGPQMDVVVVVAVDGLTASASHPVAGAARRSLAVGESLALQGTAAACNELTEAGHYVATVFNTIPSVGVRTGFRLQGTTDAAAGAAALRATTPAAPQRLTIAPAGFAQPANPQAAGHLRVLEANEALLRRLGHPPPPPPGGPTASAVAAASAAPQPGELRTFRIPDIDSGTGCTAYTAVTARAAWVGDPGVIWEDTAAPLAGTMDTAWARIGEEFDQVMYPVLLQYFGDPLAYDAQLDGDGRFFMLFSKQVNDFDLGVAGFVFSGDLYPRLSCPASDHTEIFYGVVPTDPGTGYDGNTIGIWRWGMRSVIIHEVKHIVSFATRVAEGGNFEEQWLEESTAMLAQEYYERALFGFGQHSNVTYQESIYCERRLGPNYPQCDPYPYVMGTHFSFLNAYYHDIEGLTPLGQTGSGDWSFYGSGWLFVRWAIDQSGRDEATFVRELISEPEWTGVDNIVARTGRSFRDLVADFSLAMAVDDHPAGFTPQRAQLTLPGWNTRDIFEGLYTDRNDPSPVYDRPWPMHTHYLFFGDLAVDASGVRGGSTAVFDLSGPFPGPQILQVLSPAGGATPANLGLAIVRVE